MAASFDFGGTTSTIGSISGGERFGATLAATMQRVQRKKRRNRALMIGGIGALVVGGVVTVALVAKKRKKGMLVAGGVVTVALVAKKKKKGKS